jgi:Ser/Thr protein kinase RdoA (MazF antagonist)
VYPYVEGHNACAERVEPSLAIAHTAATIARLHDLTEGLSLPRPRIRSGTDTRRVVRELLQLTTQRGIAPHETALRDFVDRVSRTLEHVETLVAQHGQNLRRGIVHHDAHCANVLFHQDRLVALIDFDDACEGYLIADLAVMIAGWAGQFGGSDSLDPTRAALVVREYERHRPLTRTERDLLPDFVVLFLAADMASHVKEQLEQGADANEAVHTWNGYRRYLHHSQDDTWRHSFHRALSR